MPGIFGVIDREQGSTALAGQRLAITRAMAAAMHYDADYVTDIVSSTVLSACVGRVGWPYAGAGAHRGSTAGSAALLTTGDLVVDSNATPGVEDVRAIGAGAAGLALELHRNGLAALGDIDGACAGFFINQRDGQCVLFNDRYGIERLFMHTEKSRTYFSSEAKAIVAVVPSVRAPDLTGLSQWLSCGCTVGSRSIFKDVEVLAGGTAVVFTPGSEPVRTLYFDRATLEQLAPLPGDRFVDEFTSSLVAASNTAINRSPRAALSLTGGLDSRLVLACLDAAPQTVPCYTFGSMYQQTMDVRVASAIAARCEQSHQVLQLDKKFLSGIDAEFTRAVYTSDGYLGLPGSAELYLNRLARHVAPARVTGNWGGELMRGVRAYKFRAPKGDFLRPPIRELLPETAEAFAKTIVGHPLSYTLFHQMPHQGFGRYAIERSQVRMRAPFLANSVVKALYQSSPATRASMAVVLKVLSRRPALIGVPTDTGRLGDGTAAVRQIRQVYRRVMVKAEYMTSHGAPDWMATLSARAPFLETAFLGRDKFQHFRHWTRNELSGFVRDTLRPDDTSSVWTSGFDMRRVAVMAEEHFAGRANYTEELDKVMTTVVLGRAIRTGYRPSVQNQSLSCQEIALEAGVSV